VDVSVQGTRVGSSVRLDIVGVRRAVAEDRAFEDPRAWKVSARAGNTPLQHVVNGSARVTREPSGEVHWDIHVAFSVAFVVPPEFATLTVHIEPPGAAVLEQTLDIMVEGGATATH
jgi:hypothetical protein